MTSNTEILIDTNESIKVEQKKKEVFKKAKKISFEDLLSYQPPERLRYSIEELISLSRLPQSIKIPNM